MSDTFGTTATSSLAQQEVAKRQDQGAARSGGYGGLRPPLSAPIDTAGRLVQRTPAAPAVDPNYQRNLQTLTNKYTELAPEIASLPEQVRNALISYDSARVAKGSNPLTREQTVLAVKTALSNQPATPAPDRNPLSILSNTRGDLSDILKSIPRLPAGLVHEVTDLANIGDRVAEAQAAGANPLSALLQAPGVRMIPGAFIAGNVLEGPTGWKELASHPLFTFLDALPIANHVAAGTDVAKVAAAGSELAGTRPRPLTAVLTGRVLRDAEGNLVRAEMTPTGIEGLGRNRVGNTMDVLRNETGVGRALDAFGGKRSRDVSRARGQLEQRFHAAMMGAVDPATNTEALAAKAGNLFEQFTDEYPFLSHSAAGPENDALRAQFYDTLQRDPSSLNPALVGQYRELMWDFAKEVEGRGKLGLFDNEWYDSTTAAKLRNSELRTEHARRMYGYKNYYLNPDPNVTYAQLRSMADDVMSVENRTYRGQQAQALEQTLDAYGLDITAIKSARSALATGKGTVQTWNDAVRSTLDAAEMTNPALTPRRTMDDIIATLRQYKRDPQAARLQDAVRRGDRAGTTAILKNLYDRKPPTFPDELYPAFRDDVRSMSRRVEFENKIGKTYTEARVSQRAANHENLRNANAPARFDALLSDEVKAQGTTALTRNAELNLGRTLTPEEAGQLTSALVERRWADMPGIDKDAAVATMRGIEKEVTATWRRLRDELDPSQQPAFVHKVSPGRANQALTGNINPLPVSVSQGKERVLDLSPGVQDVQLSVRHQAAELLQKDYNEQFITEVMDLVGRTEADLRSELADTVRWRMQRDPSLDFDGHLRQIIHRQYEKFNPEEAGTSWGGVRLDKYKQDAYYIPKSIASNLHSYAKPPSLFTSITDPVTKAFRYTVLGLSPSVVLNNFFSNSVAVMAESGPRPFKYWGEAREWIRNPGMIPDERLRAMMLAEIPNMESVSRDAWLASRTGENFMRGFNAGTAFKESAIAEGLKRGKSGLDAVVEKSLNLQRQGDNIYRAMQYMDEYDKAIAKGADPKKAADAALELVRRTLIDYTSFTPIERSAMRSIIPFYSYLSHAARFIMRYPFDHPLRASITADIAAAERERLGALPGNYLSMLPIPDFLPGGGKDSEGKQNALSLRPFDPFGDISDLMSVAGWMSATNPLVQTALQQIGVVRGEAELYPTMRYDPQTGKMKAVHGNVLMDLVHNTIPRAGLLTSALGINPAFNEVASGDPAAAKRMLVSMAGLPRAWRQTSPFQDMFKSEVARENSANEVRLNAMKSGDWTEAMRYPSLRGYPAVLRQLPPDVIAAMQPESPDQIAATIQSILGGTQ